MSLPQTLDPTAPAASDSPASGDDELRGIKQFLVDVVGVSTSAIARLLLNLQEGKQGFRNLLKNASFESWGVGTTSAPTGWTLAGSGASIARSATAKYGTYGAAVTNGASNAATLSLNPSTEAGGTAYYRGRTYAVLAWCNSGTASRARVGLNDGVTTTYSGYHTGGSTYELLAMTKTLDNAATQIQVELTTDTGSAIAVTWDAVVLIEGGTLAAFTSSYLGPEAGALQIEAISDAEATTTNVAADLKALTVTIGVGEGLLIRGSVRKSTGAAAIGQLGLKVNATQVIANTTVCNNAADEAVNGMFEFTVWQQTTNYDRANRLHAVTYGATQTTLSTLAGSDTASPIAAITSVTITGVSGSAAVTLGVRDVVAYRILTT